MKHLKIFENKSENFNVINQYNKLIDKLKPYVIYKYNKLVNDDDYYPEYNSKPHIKYNIDEMTILDATFINNILCFSICDYNNNGEIDNEYYVEFDESEMNNMKIEMKANKYNI